MINKKVRKEFKNIFEKEKGLSNYAFSLYLYIKRMYQSGLDDGIDKIFFLSREGLFLKRLFDYYQENSINQRKIETRYLYVSRKAVSLAALKEINKEEFEYLRVYNGINTIKFLESLNFTEKEISLIVKKRKKDAEIEYQCYFESQEFEKLKRNELFIEIYDNKRQTALKNLKTYLEKTGYNVQEKIAVADVGWNGTIQDKLYKIFNQELLIGYYIGSVGTSDVCRKLKKGLLFTGKSKSKSNVFIYKKYNYEYLCVANHGATAGYDEDGNPIIVPDDDIELYGKYFKDIQEAIFRKFKEIDCIVKKSGITDKMLERIIINRHALMMLSFGFRDKKIINESINMHPDNLIDIRAKKNIKSYVSNMIATYFLIVSYVKTLL